MAHTMMKLSLAYTKAYSMTIFYSISFRTCESSVEFTVSFNRSHQHHSDTFLNINSLLTLHQYSYTSLQLLHNWSFPKTKLSQTWSHVCRCLQHVENVIGVLPPPSQLQTILPFVSTQLIQQLASILSGASSQPSRSPTLSPILHQDRSTSPSSKMRLDSSTSMSQNSATVRRS